MSDSDSNSDSFISDDEEDFCPLCVEEMDITDKNFKPCPCGYQICQFCYNNIRTNPELNGKCPACRRLYEDKNIEYKTMAPDELRSQQLKMERRKKEKLKVEREKKETEQAKRHHLAGMRVIQKNLVYVVGLNPACTPEELPTVLRSEKYFGQYGKILKIVINKRSPPNGAPPQPIHQLPANNSAYGVYVTFAKKEDASRCISAVDGSISDGRVLRAAHGTTKYCSSYLRGQPCQNPNCMFLHEPGEEADSYTRQDLSTRAINNKLLERSATNGLIPPPPPQSQTYLQQQQAISAISGGSSSHLDDYHNLSMSHTSNSNSNSNRSPSTSPQVTISQLHPPETDHLGSQTSLPATVSWAKSQGSSSQPIVQTSEILSAFPTLGDVMSTQKLTKPQLKKKDKKEHKGETPVLPVDDTFQAFKLVNESVKNLNNLDEFSFSIKPCYRVSSNQKKATNSSQLSQIKLFHQFNFEESLTNKSLSDPSEDASKQHMLKLIDSLLFVPFTKNYNLSKLEIPRNPQQQQLPLPQQQIPQQQPQQFYQPQPSRFQTPTTPSATIVNTNGIKQQSQAQQPQSTQQFLQQQFLQHQQQQMKIHQQQPAGTGTPPPGLFNGNGESKSNNSAELLSQLMGKKVVA